MAGKHCGRGPVKAAFDAGFARLVYVTGGYPNKARMTDVLMGLQESESVDVVEVGVPFSDPVGDGPVIEECALEAIKEGCDSIFSVLELIKAARAAGFTLPVLLMGYYNTFQEGWVDAAKDLVSGVIVVDLPFEEPQTHTFIKSCNDGDLTFVPLVTPYTSGPRVTQIASIVDTFLYCTCVMGVTGARQSLASYLETEYQPTWKKIQEGAGSTRKILGFGVSNNEAVRAIKTLGADGLVVGSAMMKTLMTHKHLDAPQFRSEIVSFLKTLFAGAR